MSIGNDCVYHREVGPRLLNLVIDSSEAYTHLHLSENGGIDN
ncbi:10491_t:CDS:1, partial [Paraglomus brasilianum]